MRVASREFVKDVKGLLKKNDIIVIIEALQVLDDYYRDKLIRAKIGNYEIDVGDECPLCNIFYNLNSNTRKGVRRLRVKHNIKDSHLPAACSVCPYILIQRKHCMDYWLEREPITIVRLRRRKDEKFLAERLPLLHRQINYFRRMKNEKERIAETD